MPTSDTPEAGSIAVLPFPYADRLAEKRRPALVVSAPALARGHGIVWVAMVTSAKNERWPDDIAISDLDRAGLTSPSVIRPVKIATVDSTRILRIAGSVSKDELNAARQTLTRLLGNL
ncbi:mRNA interferase MazF [Mesorhizobium sp. J18]|uniref:type II toxin-antitoxin system PemK/MazF family toxin n=1 Tax=Mesorhizobium sp. J18 TaxID=935263 RepID=UPI00119BBCEA|nr:type II toxin-antitoxin system PemK/MazF family toxin [Mesorhizobium sp. J18]TWG92755.1 mRNA interferase MazF [Mesorhizobium sp. J18]